ncbi:MAG: hypothetical protein IT581_15425 [Verrucomicrobiales bacterium]|nr:hypothetical protein [Verrucomicrobiales bacterium]
MSWTSGQSIALLSALRSILTLNGTAECADAETQLIEGVRQVVLQHPELTDAQLGVFPQPADLAVAITDPEHRRRAGELLAVAPYASRPFDNTKLHIADRFVEALGEDMHEMEAFNGARSKHCRHLEYCTLRRMLADVLPTDDKAAVERELQKLAGDAEGDPQELARYQGLEKYPDGSLGRAFWKFYRQFNWPLPGDPRWISEDLTVRHDLVHVLCDYDITVNGEFMVAGFTAGNSQRFPWMIALLGFTPPYVSTGEAFQPADFLAAYRQGLGATASFVDDWDFWPRMSESLADLRKRYGIEVLT